MSNFMWSAPVYVISSSVDSVLDDAIGGYVNVVALAADEADLLRRADEAFGELGLTVSEVEETRLLDEDRNWELVNSEVQALAETVTPATPFRFGTIHSYQADTDTN